MKKTILGKLQKEIDRCNNGQGCLAYCSLATQEKCKKLLRHQERIDFCIRNNIPIEKW